MSDDAFLLELRSIRCELASIAVELAMLRLRVLLRRAFDPDQPRVPAGNPDGGQWTDGLGGSGGLGSSHEDSHVGDATGTRIAENDEPKDDPIILQDEEGTAGGIGHARRRHVGRSQMDLLQEVIDQYLRVGTGTSRATAWEPRVGSFDSDETANDLVNQVIKANKAAVSDVAEGRIKEITLMKRFGFVTGKEAYRDEADDIPRLRKTYAVKVRLVHDPRRKRGFGVRTAYPCNTDSRKVTGYPDDED
jgi:hypothetical protein